MKIDEFFNRKKGSIARHQWSEKGGSLKKLGSLLTESLGGWFWFY